MMDKRSLSIILLAAAVLLLMFGIIYRSRVAGASTSSSGSLSSGQVLQFTLASSILGTINNNGTAYLPGYGIMFQLTPGNTGDYAVLVTTNGNVLVVPDNAQIMQNTDYSNITGVTVLGSYIILGGGENAPQPWSPCATCAPYVVVYNMTNNQFSLIKLPGGSCDNMNFTSAVQGNNGDIILFGGAGPGSATGGTGFIVLNSSLQPYAYGTLSMTDSAGNQINMYRLPKIAVNGIVYMLANIPNTNTLVVESVSISDIYKYAVSSPNGACGFAGNSITPTYVGQLVTDFNYSLGVYALYTDGTNIYFPYWSVDGSIKLAVFNLSTRQTNVIPLLSGNYNYPMVRMSPNGNIYVGIQNGNTFTVYKFALNGAQVAQQSFAGIGFVDFNGYVVIFSNGLNAGSTVTVYKL